MKCCKAFPTTKSFHCCKCVSPTCSLVSIVVSVIICSIGCTLKAYLPGLVEEAILGNYVLSKDSVFFDYWVEPPISIYPDFYVFNYTNYAEFSVGWKQNGTKPKVQQLGPYVFRMSLRRSNVSFIGNDEVQFIMNYNMEFVPEMSNGSVDDVIISPNIVLRAAVQHPISKITPFIVTKVLQWAEYSYFPFVQHTIGELLVDGFYDPILEKIQGITGMSLTKDDKKFRIKDMLFPQNVIRVKTGSSGYKDFGMIAAFNNRTVLKTWPYGSPCNVMKGSALSGFPPKLSINERIHLFVDELCRSIFMRFEKEVDHHGIKANRFMLDPDVMSNTNPDYECFCKSIRNRCWGTGVFNMGECQFDAPMLLSLPHMLNVEYRIRNAIDGLAPDPEQHQFFFDLEKTTSLPVNLSIGMQLNLATEPTPWIRDANNLPEIILPIMFIKNGIDLNETISDLIKSLIIDAPLTISETFPMIIWGIGNVIGMLGISCSIYLMFKSNKIQPQVEKIFVKKFEY